jgi:hypothetical protein
MECAENHALRIGSPGRGLPDVAAKAMGASPQRDARQSSIYFIYVPARDLYSTSEMVSIEAAHAHSDVAVIT